MFKRRNRNAAGLTRFPKKFRPDEGLSRVEDTTPFEQLTDPALKEFLRKFGGVSFNSGLYRVMSPSVYRSAQSFIKQAFPSFVGRAQGFAYDWLGSIYALDAARAVDGMHAVLMLEPGTGEALEIPCNLRNFHESELIHHSEAALAAGFHKEWLSRGGPAPDCRQCIGYKRPLFLGGSDTVDNLELSDLDVYWTLSAQLIDKTRHLPPGTPIAKMSLSD